MEVAPSIHFDRFGSGKTIRQREFYRDSLSPAVVDMLRPDLEPAGIGEILSFGEVFGRGLVGLYSFLGGGDRAIDTSNFLFSFLRERAKGGGGN